MSRDNPRHRPVFITPASSVVPEEKPDTSLSIHVVFTGEALKCTSIIRSEQPENSAEELQISSSFGSQSI